jgi:hypothetical protein
MSLLLDIYWNIFAMHGPMNVRYTELDLLLLSLETICENYSMCQKHVSYSSAPLVAS